MTFLKNAWYVAAWSTEVAEAELLARRLLDEPVVIYRDPDGARRSARRSLSASICAAVDGPARRRCAAVPIPRAAIRWPGTACTTRTARCRGPRECAASRSLERYSAIWIWMGDPDEGGRERDCPSSISSCPSSGTSAPGYMAIDGGYELEIDNILDLSHIEFLHPMFASEAVSRGEMHCSQEGETVWSRRYIRDDTPPPFIYEAFNIPPGQLVDRWLDVRWHAPALMALWTGGVVADQPKEEGVNVPSAHLFTPGIGFAHALLLRNQLSPGARSGGRGHGTGERRGAAATVRARRQADHRGRGPVDGRGGLLVAESRACSGATRRPCVPGASSKSASPQNRRRIHGRRCKPSRQGVSASQRHGV